MGLLVSSSDFTGKYAISQNRYSEIDAYILKYEERYLMELLGVELFKLFKADVDTSTHKPVETEYLAIYDSFAEDTKYCSSNIIYSIAHNSVVISDGLKEMLLGLIFFEYVRDQPFKTTVSGTVKNKSENSTAEGFTSSSVYARYNAGILTYRAIQWYCFKNKIETYPLFNGTRKQLASWF